MKKLLIPLGIALAAAASGAWAKAPADATGECKDGTYTTSASKEGACSSHGGVKKWMAKEEKSSAKEAKSSSAKSSRTAAAPSSAEKPANATGECKDGTYTDSSSKSGACSGHKGVKTWYGAKESAPSSAAPSSGSTSSKSGMTSSRSTSSSMGGSSSGSTSMPKTSSTSGSSNMAAAGGGSGKVWVNTDSKVYHCEKDALYGKTKQGEYMSESQAKASGARAARGKECA